MNETLVISTEPAPLPAELPEDMPCPGCKAGPERRVKADLAGRITLCGKCGRELFRVRETEHGGR